MPVLGSDLMTFQGLPETEGLKLQAGKRHGIEGVFQIRWPKPTRNTQHLFGPYQVTVVAPDPDFRSNRLSVNWVTNMMDAKIDFIRQGTKTMALGYMVDDTYWHNRLILMDQPIYLRNTQQLRTADGQMKSGSEVLFEINCLEKILKCETPFWRVFKNGRVLGDFPSKPRAEEEIDEQSAAKLRTNKEGALIPVREKKIKWDIKEFKALDYRPEIKELIVKEKMKRNRFGWTQCSEFMEKIKPQALALIDEKKEDFKTGEKQLAVGDLVRGLRDMNEEDKMILRELLKNSPKKEVKKELVT
ncbi:MAG: hypothetical protein KJ899_15370 [Gammaproteobacteria bacterium]|nr:hypothetical protein [Gammaproteobacteria bacterium]